MFELSSKLRESSLDEITINETHSQIDIGDTTYAYNAADNSIIRTISGTSDVIAKGIVQFRVEIVEGMTIEYIIQSSTSSAGLRSSVTLREFDRPSPAS